MELLQFSGPKKMCFQDPGRSTVDLKHIFSRSRTIGSRVINDVCLVNGFATDFSDNRRVRTSRRSLTSTVLKGKHESFNPQIASEPLSDRVPKGD